MKNTGTVSNIIIKNLSGNSVAFKVNYFHKHFQFRYNNAERAIPADFFSCSGIKGNVTLNILSVAEVIYNNHKLLEVDLKHKELSFHRMVEATPIALILMNSLGKIAYLNGYAEKLFLYSKNELIGRDIKLLIPENLWPRYPDFMEEYFSNPASRQLGINTELIGLKKDNTKFPAEVSLNPIVTVEGTLAVAAVIDITERKKAHEQFEIIVESSPNALILVNHSGTIVMINKRTEQLFGYNREELIGRKIEILVPENQKLKHPNLSSEFYSQPEARPMGTGRDLYGVRKNGTEVPLEIGLTPIEKNGEDFVIASIIDITERKKHDEALRLYAQKIEEKNTELEQFTSIASHDLREPLNSISSFVELLEINKEEFNIKGDALKMLQLISRSTKRMTDLINDLLEHARLGKNTQIKKTDLNDVVAQVISDLDSAIKRTRAKITTKNLPAMNVYDVEIRVLLQNLISNALKYRKPDVPPEISVSAQKVKKGWEFEVSDNGIGIAPEQQEKIFIIFQRLHARDEYEGTGIGLAHCRKIAELHNGRIWVKSEKNKGSTFYFFIPDKISRH